MTERTINPQPAEETTGNVTLHDILRMVAANWYWFVISAAVCLGAAYYYLASTPRIYSRTATILVKDSRKGGDTDLAAFSDLAGFQNRRSVDNEVFILQSRRLMSEVVRRLGLTTDYSVRDRLRTRDLYGQSPLRVRFIDETEDLSAELTVTPLPDGRLRLSDFDDGFLPKSERRTQIVVEPGDTAATPVGKVVVERTPYLTPAYEGVPVRVRKRSLGSATSAYRNAVKCDVANKQASVVTVTMSNTVPRRAEEVIDALVAVYNEDAVEDKRRISVVTSDFIRARLDVIGRELGDVDRGIEELKRSNRMIDLQSEAARNVTESSRYKAEGLSLENQIAVARFVSDYLRDPAHAGELIPMAASVASETVAAQIDRYNEAILTRSRLLANGSEQNPVIGEMDRELAAVRRSILASLDSHIATLTLQRDAMRGEEATADDRIAAMPSQEKAMLGIARQQKIKEELYLYLLNKLEETQLNYAVAESNARIIDTAYGSPLPVSPRATMILSIALVVGLAIPFGLLYLVGMLDTTIRGRKDIEEHVSAPFLGDIPYHEGGGKAGIVVRETGRDALSEAFRILRSNMTFMSVSAGTDIRAISSPRRTRTQARPSWRRTWP